MTAVWLMVAGAGAGTLGAMLGIGGGVLLVPVLVLLFKIPFEEAVPASLICVVASSCGAAANYVEHHLSDVRLAITLELSTVSGAIIGGFAAASGLIAPAVIAVVFGLFVLFLASQILFSRAREISREDEYQPTNYPIGLAGSFVAGGLSALLGVGGGPLKVPLMSMGMKVPFKVASATSNLMIGVTGAASVAAYALHGHVRLPLVAPMVVGVLAGAMVGSRLMMRAPVALLKRLFAVVLLVIAVQMLWKGGHGLWRHV